MDSAPDSKGDKPPTATEAQDEQQKNEEKKSLDPTEQLTDEEDDTDASNRAEELFPTDAENECEGEDLDYEEESSTADNTQEVLPFSGFVRAGSGQLIPVPTDEQAEAAKRLLGLCDSPPSNHEQYGKGDTTLVCFHHAGSGSKWV